MIKNLREFRFSDLIGLYFVVSLLIGVIIPPDVEEYLPVAGIFLSFFCDILPGIKNISQYSEYPNYIKLYYAAQWSMLPVFYFLFYFSIRKTKKMNDQNSSISFLYLFYLVFFVFLSLLMIYMMGFYYKERVGGILSGRVGALLIVLSTRYMVGAAAPAVFLAIFIIAVAPVLMIEDLFACFKNRRKK